MVLIDIGRGTGKSDWDDHLDNNSKHASTGFIPFYLDYGQEIALALQRGECGRNGCQVRSRDRR